MDNRKQRILKKVFIIPGVVLALLIAWIVVSVIQRSNNTGTSIIGGADGPTAIFLIQSHPAFHWSLLALAVFVGIGIALLVRKSQEK